MQYKLKLFTPLFFLLIVACFQNVVYSQKERDPSLTKPMEKEQGVKKDSFPVFKLWVVSEGKRDSMTEKSVGMVIFNATTNKPQFYDGSIWINFTNERYIGEHYGGGIVFYIDETGKHGLIAATTDQGQQVIWGKFKNPVESYEMTIGVGRYNTKKIVSASNNETNAATTCYNLQHNGYKDWYLPSKDEVYVLYNNLKKVGIGGFANKRYWTSSETDFGNAWIYDFSNGFETEQDQQKEAHVRAIRAF